MWMSPVLYPRKSYALVVQLYGLGLVTSISKRVRMAPNRPSSLPPRTNLSRFGPPVEAITIPESSFACPSAATYHCSRAAAGCPRRNRARTLIPDHRFRRFGNSVRTIGELARAPAGPAVGTLVPVRRG